MTSAPIRQPRGPPSDSSSQPLAFALSPPTADADLRRANTFSTPRHQASASVSSIPSTTSSYHGHGGAGQGSAGGRFKGMGRFRSGSLSSGDAASGLVRKGSGRDAVRTEEAVVEDEIEETTEAVESESFAKGLSRQSSLPSRRCESLGSLWWTWADPQLLHPWHQWLLPKQPKDLWAHLLVHPDVFRSVSLKRCLPHHQYRHIRPRIRCLPYTC